MNKAFKNIISQIEELANYNRNAYLDSADVIEIVQEVAEEYNGGWIACIETLSKLEERTAFLKDCTKYGNRNAEQQEKSYSTMMMYEVADLVDDLIEIVKQGSVSDDVCGYENTDDEHCKWKINSVFPETINNPHVAERENISTAKYCPCCGKKIKAVE